MSGDFKTGNGGAYIQPSARRSIHSHSNCPFRNDEVMGRYGINKRQDRDLQYNNQVQKQTSQSEGTDEIDNVMSKFAHPSSPISTRRDRKHRRNSFSSQEDYFDDLDEDSELLSKSSPAILSPSHCSSQEEDSLVINSRNNSSTSVSNLSPQQGRWNERSGSVYNTPVSKSQASQRFEQNSSKSKINCNYWVTGSIVAFLATILVVYSNISTTNSIKKGVNEIVYDELHFYNDVNDVGAKYKIPYQSLLQVQAGIATIFEREDTGSFIFAYDSDKTTFSLNDFNNFVNELASIAARYLRNDTKIVHHVVVDTNNLHAQTAKDLMNEYLTDVGRTGVMLVKEIDRVPSSLAMAFHYYCDDYNPLVKKSAIFFTLNMAKCSKVTNGKSKHGSTRVMLEKCLASKWENVPKDNIKPLLNRVVNVVIDVSSDF